MQEWINNKKNLPIAIGLLSVVMIAAIVFILFQTGVLGGNGQTDASAPPASPAAPATPPPAPGAPVASAPPGAPVAPGAPAAATAVKVAAAPPVLGAPGARPDPFEPYIDYNTWLRDLIKKLPPPPRVDTMVPFVRVTNYVPPASALTSHPNIPNLPSIPNSLTQQASIGRVSGVMLTNGAFAIVDNQQGQSSIVQPGDQLPNGGGRVISIQADGITVRSGDQMVKVPITSGDATNQPGGGPNGPNGPQGPFGPPNYPGGNGPPIQQDDNTNGG